MVLKFLIFSFFLLTILNLLDAIIPSVNFYVDYINNSKKRALEYEFPDDEARMYQARNQSPKDYGEFDFIIVGGGSTGCVIANRLSQVSKWKILLLEAGTFRDADLTGIPALWIEDATSKFNWGFKSVPQKYACQGSEGQICHIPRGRGLGGSSLINCAFYTRGNRIDYQRWSELLNDPSWSYEEVLRHFINLETFTRKNPYVPIDEVYHGHFGPLQTAQAAPPQNISNSILEAGQQFGYNITDYNGRQQMGTSVFQFFIKDGRRFDPSMAFITPINNRKNLKILDRSYVTKIDISRSPKRARGVIFTRNNSTYFARARKEVILSAGTISSPHILMLSGIGPKKHLESHKIPVIQNLPVGRNLHDHTITFLTFTSNSTDEPDNLKESVKELLKGEGPLTRSFAYDAINWFQTPLAQVENYPDIETVFTKLDRDPLVQKFFGWTNETHNALYGNSSSVLALSLTPCHPISKGSVKLKSNNPFDYPLIDPNILSADQDMEVLYESVQVILKWIQTPALRSLDLKLALGPFPGCEDTETFSKEYWYCYSRRITGTAYHPLSTCSIGTNPENGVVDKNLKVFGMDRLRVADASVIPFNLAAHPNAVCNMIGEKISREILKFYRGILLWQDNATAHKPHVAMRIVQDLGVDYLNSPLVHQIWPLPAIMSFLK